MAYLLPYGCQCWHGATPHVAPPSAKGAPRSCLSAQAGNSSVDKTGHKSISKNDLKNQVCHGNNCFQINTQCVPYCYCNTNFTYYTPPLPPPLPPESPSVSGEKFNKGIQNNSNRLHPPTRTTVSKIQLNKENSEKSPTSNTSHVIKPTNDATDVEDNEGLNVELPIRTTNGSPLSNELQNSAIKNGTTQASLSSESMTIKERKQTSPKLVQKDSEMIDMDDMKPQIKKISDITKDVEASHLEFKSKQTNGYTKPKTLKPSRRPTKLRDCRHCEKEHALKKCFRFLRMNVEKRWSIIEKHKYCANCLAHSHTTAECPSSIRCKKCNEKHHKLLHDDPEKEHMKNRKQRETEMINNVATEVEQSNEAEKDKNKMENTQKSIIDLDDAEFDIFNIPLPNEIIVIDDDEGEF